MSGRAVRAVGMGQLGRRRVRLGESRRLRAWLSRWVKVSRWWPCRDRRGVACRSLRRSRSGRWFVRVAVVKSGRVWVTTGSSFCRRGVVADSQALRKRRLCCVALAAGEVNRLLRPWGSDWGKSVNESRRSERGRQPAEKLRQEKDLPGRRCDRARCRQGVMVAGWRARC